MLVNIRQPIYGAPIGEREMGDLTEADYAALQACASSQEAWVPATKREKRSAVRLCVRYLIEACETQYGYWITDAGRDALERE